MPCLRIVRLRVAEHPVDASGLHVVAFRAETCGSEGADVSIHGALALQERTEQREGFLRAALLEQVVGPWHTGCRRGPGRGGAGAFLPHLPPRRRRPEGVPPL